MEHSWASLTCTRWFHANEWPIPRKKEKKTIRAQRTGQNRNQVLFGIQNRCCTVYVAMSLPCEINCLLFDGKHYRRWHTHKINQTIRWDSVRTGFFSFCISFCLFVVLAMSVVCYCNCWVFTAFWLRFKCSLAIASCVIQIVTAPNRHTISEKLWQMKREKHHKVQKIQRQKIIENEKPNMIESMEQQQTVISVQIGFVIRRVTDDGIQIVVQQKQFYKFCTVFRLLLIPFYQFYGIPCETLISENKTKKNAFCTFYVTLELWKWISRTNNPNYWLENNFVV